MGEVIFGAAPVSRCWSLEEGAGGVLRIAESLREYRDSLRKKAGFQDETAGALAAAADQFISYRASTDNRTILAGYPFFEDWGRDTMISLPGCCISTKRYDVAESILRTFMMYSKKGLMPNLFPEGKQEPMYNTVDAALLFIIAVYEYYMRTKDKTFVTGAWAVMQEIVDWYRRGTDFNIAMEEDGLIRAGEGYDQVTWMDVRIGDILPTPRHGKPVEINAYWYNVLRIMDFFQDRLKGEVTEDGTQIRCNQIWAVSLPFSLLNREQEKQVVETVFRKLYTPLGLRTLDPADPEFQPFYGGEQLKRDLAYHQGTVWTYPLGGYYLAYLKVHDYADEAKAHVRTQLESITAALREGCIGQLPEIYDGERPVSSKGCFAQAWSVGELLRVYEALES